MGPRLDATCDAALLMVQGRIFEDGCDDARWSGGVSRRAQRKESRKLTRFQMSSDTNVWVHRPFDDAPESARASVTTAGVKDTLTF